MGDPEKTVVLLVQMKPEDQIILAKEVASQLCAEVMRKLPFLEHPELAQHLGKGVQVVSVGELAERLGKTTRQVEGLERRGGLPPRRRIGARRVGYLAHELDEIPADVVRVRGHTLVGPDEVARKTGLHVKTVRRMAEEGELPRSVRGRWYAREIDEWLLARPVCSPEKSEER